MKVAIIEDHPLMAQSLKNVLATLPRVDVVGVYANGRAFFADMRDAPDIVLLDYHLPDMTGVELCRKLRADFQDTKVIVLTGYEKPGLFEEISENGCSGYLLKSYTDSATLAEALERVQTGEVYMDQHMEALYERRPDGPQKDLDALKLTSRETEILKEVVNGLSSKEISEKLFISRRTVENHRSSIMTKTSSKNLAALIHFAREARLF